MSTLSADKVLRVNCPGFGVSSTLPLGEAKPLAMYDVLIINPVSMIHLFEPESATAREINKLIADGVTSLTLDSAANLDSLSAEMELRENEIRQFLNKGGLLVYFLAPPFTVSGPDLSIDNYKWLYEWAPDQGEPSDRKMSTSTGGRNIELTKKGKRHPLKAYLEHPDLEFSTVIRSENLADGYVSLAESGGSKCVAAYKVCGPKRGEVLFLPAPYEPALDDVLKQCLLRWYELHLEPDSEGGKDARETEPLDLSGPDVDGKSLLDDLFSDMKSPVAGEKKKGKSIDWPELGEDTAASSQAQETASADSSGEPPGTDGAAGEDREPQSSSASESHSPEARELMSRMEKKISTPSLPEWCSSVTFLELSKMQTELEELSEQIKQAKAQMAEVEARMRDLAEIKDALLALSGPRLTQACRKVFEKLGWSVEPSGDEGKPEELWLKDEDQMQGIVRVIYSTGQPNRSELAELSGSVISYWDRHDIEPKGILVASTFADRPPKERDDLSFAESLTEFAKRKNLCLLTCTQLLTIYRDVAVAGEDPKQVRENLLTTSGELPALKLELSEAVGASA